MLKLREADLLVVHGSRGDHDRIQTLRRSRSACRSLVHGHTFYLYGYFKLTGYAGTVAYMGRQGLPAPALFAALAVIIELGGGVLVLDG